MSTIPRIQEVVIPILRAALPGVHVGSWMADPEDRVYPTLNVRRLGGLPVDIRFLDRAVIELTSYGNVNLEETEQLLLDAQEAIWNATNTPAGVIPGVGYLHSYRQTMGPTQFDSPYDDVWRSQSLIQLGLRPIL